MFIEFVKKLFEIGNTINIGPLLIIQFEDPTQVRNARYYTIIKIHLCSISF